MSKIIRSVPLNPRMSRGSKSDHCTAPIPTKSNRFAGLWWMSSNRIGKSFRTCSTFRSSWKMPTSVNRNSRLQAGNGYAQSLRLSNAMTKVKLFRLCFRSCFWAMTKLKKSSWMKKLPIRTICLKNNKLCCRRRFRWRSLRIVQRRHSFRTWAMISARRWMQLLVLRGLQWRISTTGNWCWVICASLRKARITCFRSLTMSWTWAALNRARCNFRKKMKTWLILSIRSRILCRRISIRSN